MQVEIPQGRLEGTPRGRHVAFLGIPFARPPVGPRRFGPPEPPEPWAGLRKADAFGPAALQGGIFVQGVQADVPTSEDCLYLNVYTPAPDGERRPVMVWIHGGAFIAGTAGSPLYDGDRLAERGDVVVVTLNYRLGAFGYLHLGDAGRNFGAVDNAGLLDQIAALEWVRDNIARFGGDPHAVTVFGESAGATSVCLLLVAPAARGLFARAISQSSAATLRLSRSDRANKTTELMLEELGLTSKTAGNLMTLPAESIRQAQLRVERRAVSWRGFFPILDPRALPEDPKDVLSRNDTSPPPLIIGANRDEWNLFVADSVATWATPLSEADALSALERVLPAHPTDAIRELLGTYRGSRKALGLPSDNRALLRAIEGDLRFRMASLWWTEAYQKRQAATYAYLFSHESPALRGALGACHALELPFVFGTLDAPGMERFAGSGPACEALSDAMMTDWLAFAREGDPNAAQTHWPRFDTEQRATRVYDEHPRVEAAPFEAERQAWAALYRARRTPSAGA